MHVLIFCCTDFRLIDVISFLKALKSFRNLRSLNLSTHLLSLFHTCIFRNLKLILCKRQLSILYSQIWIILLMTTHQLMNFCRFTLLFWISQIIKLRFFHLDFLAGGIFKSKYIPTTCMLIVLKSNYLLMVSISSFSALLRWY